MKNCNSLFLKLSEKEIVVISHLHLQNVDAYLELSILLSQSKNKLEYASRLGILKMFNIFRKLLESHCSIKGLSSNLWETSLS
jgi:hypothetical protein